MTENSKYPTVRDLTRRDRITFSLLIEKMAEKSGDLKITELVPGMSKKGTEAEAEDTEAEDKIYDLMKGVLGGLVKWCNEDLTVWFMDITNIEKVEDFDALPFDTDMHIIEQLVDRENFINFFIKASALYKKIRGLLG